MKKYFQVLILAAAQYGCATPTATQVEHHALISYVEIAAEIQISYQATNGPAETTQPVAADMPSSM